MHGQQKVWRFVSYAYPFARQIGAARRASSQGSISVQLEVIVAAYFWDGDDHSDEKHPSSLRVLARPRNDGK
jgi:hypothetical protein